MSTRMASKLFDGNTYESQYQKIANGTPVSVNSLYVGRSTDLGTTENTIVDIINAPADVIASTLKTADYAFRDTTGGTSGQTGTSAIGQIFTAQVGKFQVGESVNNFISSSVVGSLFNSAGSVASETINIGSTAVGSALGATASTAAAAASTATKAIEGYVAPITDTINTLNNIGAEFDKIIKDTFLGQVFKIKGSEILCALFCLIISMLSCSTRQSLYEAIVAIKQGIATINSSIDSINNLTRNPVEVPLFDEKTIAESVKGLFGDKLQGKALDKALNIPGNTSSKKPISSLTIPPDIEQTINNLVLILSILAKGQITIPVGITGDIWAFAQAALAIIQQMLIQMLDEFMTKVIKKVETELKKMMPQLCVGNLAAMFINRIISAVNALKAYILSQLSALLGDFNGFGLKWKTFGWYFKEIQELLALLKALQMIIKKFPDLALLCGISPCDEVPSKSTQDIIDAIAAGQFIEETNEPARVLPASLAPQGKTLDDLADIFSEMTGKNACVMETSTGFCVMLPEMFADAPKMITDLVASPEFLTALGGAYTVFTNPTVPGINIVYTYELKCQ